MKHNDFCILILTHGRPDKQVTLSSLQRRNCKYPIYFVIDDEDKTAAQYKAKFGDRVIEFNKMLYADMTDECDNFNDRRAIVHARNASYDIAEKLGYKYFIQLDDDYTNFSFRFDESGTYDPLTILDIDQVFDAFLDFYKSSSFHTIAFAQGGDYIGGQNGSYCDLILRRKAMNTFFCSTERRIKFIGRLNEDVNVYTALGKIGYLFGTIMQASITQLQTQSNSGGITDMYKDVGTYVKSFYTIMLCPSSVRINSIGNSRETQRIHHQISWRHTVPVILSEDQKKQ